MDNLYVQISLVDISDLDLVGSRDSGVKNDPQGAWRALDALNHEVRSSRVTLRSGLRTLVLNLYCNRMINIY